ncbi:MAG: AAA family ATPase [Solirubrobacterales bacterium]|nr:AAA family ATPase [Solirubrobacterales bacterium]
MESAFPGVGRCAHLLGRGTECALLADVLAAIRRGEGRSLVLRGEAGIGKTALLTYVVDSACDFTVLRAVGVESEMELAYAGLHQLCAPVFHLLTRLPEPQSDALQMVFGLKPGATPDRFLVALATLSLFSAAADERPLLCAVDDAQWLDRATGLTLGFVTRRLLAEPLGLVFAAREAPEELQGIPQFEVPGLGEEDARALLASEIPFTLDERVRDEIVVEARGNPLALLELPQGLTAAELAVGFGFLGAQTLSGRIEDSFKRRLERLSPEARLFLLVAAAEPLGDPLLVWSAAERLGIGAAASASTETGGLVAIADRVSFRHPLVRSAVYRSAAVQDRTAVHLALADVTDQEADPDRRAWHLAAATTGPDEQVAGELERSAGRAQARGGFAAAAAFLQRAVALTRDAARRADRALAAAHASLQAGAFDRALSLLATAEAGSLDKLQRARVDLLRGHVAFASGNGDAPRLLLKAARRLEPFNVALARETYLNAWGAAALTTHLDRGSNLLAVSRAIRALPPPPGDRGPLDLLLEGLALVATDGHAAATATLRRAAIALLEIPVEDVLRWGWGSASASTAIWDDERLHAIAVRQVQLVRDAGELAQLPIHLSVLAHAEAWMGDLRRAASLVAEVDSVTATTGSHIAPYALLKLRALQGSEAEASAPIAGAIEQGFPHAYVAAAVLYNGLARYEEAASAARQAAEASFEPWASVWALAEAIEAAARTGDPELARDALQRLAETTQPCGTDWALGIEARCRALISDGEAAEHLYREAIDRLSRTRLRPDLARAHLLYGEWLRRVSRRTDARAQLRAAYDQCTAIGMEAFAARARSELLATGEKVRRRTVETRDDLTAHERQIAELARDGLSNPEIGERLFLSPRTVEWHLRKVFTKLGISSRKELRRVLREPEGESIFA